MDEKIFKEQMIILQKYYGHKLDNLVYSIYNQKLNHLSNEKFCKCVGDLIESEFRPTSRVPFPLVCDFLKCCGEGTEDRAYNVVGHTRKAVLRLGAYNSVNLGDTALHSVIKSFGGWINICNWSNDDWKMKQTNFINSYKSALKINTKNDTYLAGIHEFNNVGRYEVKKPIEFFLNNYNNVKQISHQKRNLEIENITKSLTNKFTEVF